MKKLSFTLFALLLTAKAFCQPQVVLNPSFGTPGSPNLGNWNVATNWEAGTNQAGNSAALTTAVAATASLSQTATTNVTGSPGFLLVRFDFDWTAAVGGTSATTLTVNFISGTTTTAATIVTPATNVGGSATGTAPGGVTSFPANMTSDAATTKVGFSVPLTSIPANAVPFTISFSASAPAGPINILRVTNVEVSLNTALPITLEYFTGTKQQKNITLQWQTAKEDNLDRYEIEQSVNGVDYTRVGTVAPHGIEKPYEFSNEYALSGDVYFRLKSVDKDGTFEYSKTLNFKMEGSDAVTIFPNPVTDQLSVKGKFAVGKSYNVRIVNTVGQTVKMLEYTPTQDGLISLNQVGTLPQGVYLLEVADKGIIARERFVR